MSKLVQQVAKELIDAHGFVRGQEVAARRSTAKQEAHTPEFWISVVDEINVIATEMLAKSFPDD